LGKVKFNFVGDLLYKGVINTKLGLVDSAEVAVSTQLCIGTVAYAFY